MYPNHLGDDDTTTTSPAEYGLVDNDDAHILEPPCITRCG
jgi:hypothetical protein